MKKGCTLTPFISPFNSCCHYVATPARGPPLFPVGRCPEHRLEAKPGRGKIMKTYRQGDVSILAVNEVPKKARKVKGAPILAHGEVTGHSHRIVEGRVFMYQVVTGLLYLRVLSEVAKLYHEEHEDIILPKGDYEVRRQREFDPFAGRRGEGGIRYGVD